MLPLCMTVNVFSLSNMVALMPGDFASKAVRLSIPLILTALEALSMHVKGSLILLM